MRAIFVPGWGQEVVGLSPRAVIRSERPADDCAVVGTLVVHLILERLLPGVVIASLGRRQFREKLSCGRGGQLGASPGP